LPPHSSVRKEIEHRDGADAGNSPHPHGRSTRYRDDCQQRPQKSSTIEKDEHFPTFHAVTSFEQAKSLKTKKPQEVTQELPDFKWFDPKFATAIP
jgi:hypothetical protein